MGGLVAAGALLKQSQQPEFRAAILLCPWLKTLAPVNPVARAMAPLVKMVYPEFSQDSNVRPEELTSDPAEQARILREKGSAARAKRATVGWFLQMERLQAEVLEGAGKITLPVLVGQAGDDKIVCAAATRALFDRIGSASKEYALFEGMKHEVHNEKERGKGRKRKREKRSRDRGLSSRFGAAAVLERVAEFVLKHIPPAAASSSAAGSSADRHPADS
eukprot:tig00000391_g24849.t1